MAKGLIKTTHWLGMQETPPAVLQPLATSALLPLTAVRTFSCHQVGWETHW